MRKFLKYVFITIIIIFIIWILFGVIMTFGHKSMPVVEVPKELRKLKSEIDNIKTEIIFYEISEFDLKNCNAKQEVTIRTSEDSIVKSKIALDNYILSLRHKINLYLINKNCIDSLIIKAYVIKSQSDNRYRYSFPIQ